jgi:hypothetical protein
VNRIRRFERKGRAMHVSRRGIGLVLPLAVAVVALGAPGAQGKPEPSADPITAHWKHEDAVYGSSEARMHAQTTAAQIRAAHWRHEDALYRAAGSPGAAPTVAVDDGLGWSEALTGAGGAVALILLGGAATVVIRRRHGGLAQS